MHQVEDALLLVDRYEHPREQQLNAAGEEEGGEGRRWVEERYEMRRGQGEARG